MIRTLFTRKESPAQNLQQALGTPDLPSFPDLVWRVLEMLQDPEVPLTKTGRLIAADPGLSAQLIKTVNCAAYGLPNRVNSASHALSMLGPRKVESIVLSIAVKKALPTHFKGGFDPAGFWRSSAIRAVTASSLARLLDPASADLSFTAALLQDMAVPLIARHNHKAYAPVLSAWRAGEEGLDVLEHEMLGYTHAEIAGWMSEKWAFPEDLRKAIQDHHNLDQGPTAVTLVALLKEGENDEGTELLMETVREHYGIGTDRIALLLKRCEEEAKQLTQLLAGL